METITKPIVTEEIIRKQKYDWFFFPKSGSGTVIHTIFLFFFEDVAVFVCELIMKRYFCFVKDRSSLDVFDLNTESSVDFRRL